MCLLDDIVLRPHEVLGAQVAQISLRGREAFIRPEPEAFRTRMAQNTRPYSVATIAHMLSHAPTFQGSRIGLKDSTKGNESRAS